MSQRLQHAVTRSIGNYTQFVGVPESPQGPALYFNSDDFFDDDEDETQVDKMNTSTQSQNLQTDTNERKNRSKVRDFFTTVADSNNGEHSCTIVDDRGQICGGEIKLKPSTSSARRHLYEKHGMEEFRSKGQK